MGGYGYAYRGNTTYNDLAPKTDDWGKTSYASDHVCKPVIVDADRRKYPIVYYNALNAETRVVETETIMRQEVHSPFINDYKQNTHTKVEPLKGYGHVEDQWNRSSSPVHGLGRPHKVDEFLSNVQTEASKPRLLSPSLWRQPSNSTGHHGHGYERGNTGYGDYKPGGQTIQNGDYDNYNRNNHNRMEPPMITSGGWARPSRAGWAAPPDTTLSRPTNDIGTPVEYLEEAARPTSVIASPPSRMPVPITTGPKRDHDFGNTGYGDYKPGGHTIQNGDYDNYIRNNQNRMEPATTRPSRAEWAASPDTTLSRPTNDIGTAMEYLKEAARPTSVTASPHSRVTVPNTTGPKRDHDYVETIDSREAARRYGNFRPSSVPEERYTRTIDSREAARKYKGTTV